MDWILIYYLLPNEGLHELYFRLTHSVELDDRWHILPSGKLHSDCSKWGCVGGGGGWGGGGGGGGGGGLGGGGGGGGGFTVPWLCRSFRGIVSLSSPVTE